MANIDPVVFERLKNKLGLSRARIYKLIEEEARQSLLPANLAAIKLAADRGVSIAKLATPEQLAAIRSASSKSVDAIGPVPRVTPSPRSRVKESTKSPSKRKSKTSVSRRGTSVFVVHGRDERLRNSVFQFLRSVGLHPIEWSEAVKNTKKANPYIQDIIDTAFKNAVAIVVVLSPDDEAKLKTVFVKKSDPMYEKRLTGQARPNVLFEAGMAFGYRPENTVLVQVGNLRPFSDVAGRHILRLSNDPKSRHSFLTRLGNAGCNVDSTGQDWMTTGDFGK